jgi:hypothetical protein
VDIEIPAYIQKAQAFQSKHKLWPVPAREVDEAHVSSEYPDMIISNHHGFSGYTEYHGTAQTDGHKLYTMGGAIAIAEANAKHSRLFFFGEASFDGSNEKRKEAVIFKISKDGSAAEGMVRYTDYFSSDANRLVDSSSLVDPELIQAMSIQAKQSGDPYGPNDTERTERMKTFMRAFLGSWQDSENAKPWKDSSGYTEEGADLEEVLLKWCSPTCTIAMPLQQVVVQASDFYSQWKTRQGGWRHFGRTNISMVADGYGGHHPLGYAQIIIKSINPRTNMEETSNGLVVCEFDYESGTKVDRIVLFRNFLSETERDSILVK